MLLILVLLAVDGGASHPAQASTDSVGKGGVCLLDTHFSQFMNCAFDRMLGLLANQPPKLTPPPGSPYQVATGSSVLVGQGPGGGYTPFIASDPDTRHPDYVMGVAWLDCGRMSISGMPATTFSDDAIGHPMDLLAKAGVSWSQFPAGLIPNPSSWPADPMSPWGVSQVESFAWLSTLGDSWSTDRFNKFFQNVQFQAPALPGTCTLTVLVTDFGVNFAHLPPAPNPSYAIASVEFHVVDVVESQAPAQTAPQASATTLPPAPTPVTSTPAPEPTSTATPAPRPTSSTAIPAPPRPTSTEAAPAPRPTSSTTLTIPERETTTTTTQPRVNTTTTVMRGAWRPAARAVGLLPVIEL